MDWSSWKTPICSPNTGKKSLKMVTMASTPSTQRLLWKPTYVFCTLSSSNRLLSQPMAWSNEDHVLRTCFIAQNFDQFWPVVFILTPFRHFFTFWNLFWSICKQFWPIFEFGDHFQRKIFCQIQQRLVAGIKSAILFRKKLFLWRQFLKTVLQKWLYKYFGQKNWPK
jgi:hypothetical protein